MRGTTCTCRWGTLWLTTLFIATKCPRRPIAAGTAAREPLGGARKGPDLLGRQVAQGLDVGARDEQGVPVEERPEVEEGERAVGSSRTTSASASPAAICAEERSRRSGNDRQRAGLDRELDPVVVADVVAVDLEREGRGAPSLSSEIERRPWPR